MKTELVPYVSIIGKKGNITELDYGLIRHGSQKVKFIKPSEKSSVKMFVDFKDREKNFDVKWFTFEKSTKNLQLKFFPAKNKLAFNEDDLRRIRLRVRRYDSDDNLYVYQWNFYASSGK